MVQAREPQSMRGCILGLQERRKADEERGAMSRRWKITLVLLAVFTLVIPVITADVYGHPDDDALAEAAQRIGTALGEGGP